jgi:hypothetical protein
MTMPLSFVETMRGWMRDERGLDFPISFELAALRVERGRFEVRGLIAAPPLATEAPGRGTLEIGVGSIAYHLEFLSSTGQRLSLDATKHPSLLAPIRSMTRMTATITEDSGRSVASGEMTFQLADLPAFAASWLPGIRSARLALDGRRRQLERLVLAGPEAR